MRTDATDSSGNTFDSLKAQNDESDWESVGSATLASTAWAKSKDLTPMGVYCKDGENQADPLHQVSACEPCKKLSKTTWESYRPADSKKNYWSPLPTRSRDSDAKRLSDTAETCGSLLIGAICSKKFSYEIVESKEQTLTLAERSLKREV